MEFKIKYNYDHKRWEVTRSSDGNHFSLRASFSDIRECVHYLDYLCTSKDTEIIIKYK